MLLGGVLSKFGGYGMIMLFLFSGLAVHYSVYIGMLGGFSALYAALLLIRQKDLKRVVAYSAMLEMGIVLVAIAAVNSVGTSGAAYGMVSQGIGVALAFLAVGVIGRVFDERNMDRLRGMVDSARSSAYAFAMGMLSMIGFPITSGFVASVLIFFGAAQGFGAYGLLPLAAVLLMGGFFYVVISNCLLSKSRPLRAIGRPSVPERFGFYALSAAVIAFGVLPFLVLRLVGM
jgi:NADH-quinone oxidoreductase subunit M